MRLGLNGLFLQQPMTGSGQYTHHLWRQLVSFDTENEYVLLCTQPPRGLDGLGEGSRARYYVPSRRLPAVTENVDKLVWEQLALPAAIRKAGIDLLHTPYFAGPVVFSGKLVMTIHDLIPLVLPEYGGSTLVRLYTKLVSIAARRADAIITDSECSKRDIGLRLRIHPDKIRVIYLAVDDFYRPVEDSEVLRQVRSKYGLNGEFIFYVGGLDVRKNVPRLIQAFACARPSFRSHCQLAIAGRLESKPSTMFPDLQAVAGENHLQREVVFLGLVPEEEKLLLYNAATALVFPSIYEGFGLTPLEAMACGTPVISSSAASLMEVVDDAAIVVNPYDVDGLAGAMVDVVNDRTMRGSLREKGLIQSRKFSWRRTAEETLEVYRSAVSGRR
ncbi:MAG: glycosyltransferase family 4 protein [Chloroflexi bacterium]|nr:glycosyltransferase family 4 protein [Chloroflexota bacterium]